MKTLKELLEGATDAEWIHLPGERIVFTKLNDGCRGVPVVSSEYEYLPSAQSNLALIARCNPATMRLVLEALTLTEQLLDSPLDYTPRQAAIHEAVVSALAALNGASHGEQGEGR